MATATRNRRSRRAMKTIQFDKRIYDEDAIIAAAQEFVGFSSFEIAAEGDIIEVQMSDIEPDVEHNIAGEFSNYVIFMMKKEHKI